MLGSLILLLTIGLGFLSWQLANRQQFTNAILVLMILGGGLRLFVSSDAFLHDWDERYHALVAKNLMENPWVPKLYDNPALSYEYQDWSRNEVWLHKPPLTLWFIAGSFRLFGVNLWALRLPSVLMSTLLIPLLFFLGGQLFNKRVGYLAAFLMSIQGFVVELSAGRFATDHPDVHFLFWVTCSIAATVQFHHSQRGYWNILAAVGLGAAILTKWLPALIIVPIWLVMAWPNRSLRKNYWSDFILFLLVVLVMVVPWQWYIYNYFPQEAGWEAYYNRLHLFQAVEGQEGDIFFHLNKLRIQYGELIYLPLLWIVFHFRILIRRTAWQVVLLWLILPYSFFSLVATKMPAYPLFAAPAVLLITAFAWYLLRLNWHRSSHPRFYCLVMVLLLVLPVRFSLERVKLYRTPLLRDTVYQEARERFKTYQDDEFVFGEPFPIEAMFFSDCLAAYSWIPTPQTLDSLRTAGHRLKLVNPPKN